MILLERVLPVAIGLDEVDEVLEGLLLRYILFDALLVFVEDYFAGSRAYIAVVGVVHFTRTIDDAAHDADFETF